MKILKLTAFILVSIMITGCNKNDRDHKEEIAILDLKSHTYDSAYEILTTNKAIKIVASNYFRVVNDLEIDNSIMSNSNEKFLKSNNDSISILITDQSISIVTENKVGSSDRFLIHKDESYIAKYHTEYNQQLSQQLKSNSAAEGNIYPVVLSPNSSTLSISSSFVFNTEEAELDPTATPTSSSYTKSFTRDHINIYILRAKSYGGEHALNWQKQHAVDMMKDIYPSIKIHFHTYDADFSATLINDSYEKLKEFRTWLKSPDRINEEWAPAVGKDIFMLVNYWGFSKLLGGIAWVNTYERHRESNSYAIGMAGISPILLNRILAHELAHILGGEHSDHVFTEKLFGFIPIRRRDLLNNDIVSMIYPLSNYVREPTGRAEILANIKDK